MGTCQAPQPAPAVALPWFSASLLHPWRSVLCNARELVKHSQDSLWRPAHRCQTSHHVRFQELLWKGERDLRPAGEDASFHLLLTERLVARAGELGIAGGSEPGTPKDLGQWEDPSRTPQGWGSLLLWVHPQQLPVLSHSLVTVVALGDMMARLSAELGTPAVLTAPLHPGPASTGTAGLAPAAAGSSAAPQRCHGDL